MLIVLQFGSAEGVVARRLDDGAGRGARGRGKRILRARAAPGSARGALGPPRQELADGACATLGALRKRGRCRKTPQVERREARSRDRKRGRHASQACLGRLSPAAHRRLAQSLRVSRRSAPLKGEREDARQAHPAPRQKAGAMTLGCLTIGVMSAQLLVQCPGMAMLSLPENKIRRRTALADSLCFIASP